MPNTALQNPSNKVGRNSGAGPAGLSAINPTEAEARRGLEPISTEHSSGWMRSLGLGLGALAVLGAGWAAYGMQQRQRRSLRGRVQRMIGMN